MADATLAYLEAQDLGRVEQNIALRGKLAVRPGLTTRAHLVRTARGLYLTGAKSRDLGLAIDLLERDDFHYERGAFGDRIVVGELVLPIPASARRELRLAVALARLQSSARVRFNEAWVGRHVSRPSALERAVLESELEPEELLLAFRQMDRDAPVESRISPGTAGTGYLLVTERRAARVVLSPLGDVRVESLDGVRLELDEGIGSADLLAGRFRWPIPRSDVELTRELLGAIERTGRERIREIARLNWRGRSDDAALSCSRALLQRAARDGDPVATCTAFMLACELGEPANTAPEVDAAVALLANERAAPRVLAQAWLDWELTPESALTLLDQLRRHGDEAEPWALALHEALHARLAALRKDPRRLARADVELAEHLLKTGNRERAQELLEARLSELPSEELEDLLPGENADLTIGDGGQVLRIRVFELLAEARRSSDGPDVRAISELARLQPLVVPRVKALADCAVGSAKERAEHVLKVLEPGGLRPSREPLETSPSQPKALTGELLHDVLPHPVAREGSALVGKIQTLLAAVPAPDHRMLLEYVEPITVARHPSAARALSRAAHVLGMDAVSGFVSRGKKGIGFRSYENPNPFVMIGGRHLDDDPDYGMTPDEMAFASAMEIAHLRYGHARVTSSEVWTGLFERSKEGLDLLLGLLPLFKGYRMAERAYQVLQKVPTDTIRRVVGGASAVRRRLASRPSYPDEPVKSDDVLSTVHEDLVATARVMQLTADRAGLIVAGDLRAALRAMLLVRRDHRDELATAEREGIESLLRRRDEDGQLTHQALAVRLAALVSFYLSDDYARLRAALR